MTGKREKPFSLHLPFSDALARFAQAAPEEISLSAKKIKALAPKMASKEIGPERGQGSLIPVAEKEIGGIGMGVLSDGAPYLNHAGIGRHCAPPADLQLRADRLPHRAVFAF